MLNSFEPDVISYSDYYPFGWTMPGREGSSENYRYGFQGQERDDETTVDGGSLDFGARIYDSRVGRFFSTDPKIKTTPYNSSYLFANNSPIFFIDFNGESGVASLTNEINEKTGRPILKVQSNIHIYGKLATEAVTVQLETELNCEYNNNNDYFTFKAEDGTVYDVVFEFKVDVIDESKVDEGLRKLDPIDNYFEIGDDERVDVSFTLNGKNGGNAGYLLKKDIENVPLVASHEKNHGFGGEAHSDKTGRVIKYNDEIDVSMARGTQYYGGGKVDVSKRKVTQRNIDKILDDVKFENGKGAVGTARPFKVDVDNEKQKSTDVRQ